MAEHDDEAPTAGSAVEKREPRQVSAGTAVVTSDVFQNPGEPPHRDRVTDIDPKVEKRAERQVSLFFFLSIVGSIAAIGA